MRLPTISQAPLSPFDLVAAAHARDELGVKLRNDQASAVQYRQAMALSKETPIEIPGKLVRILNGKRTERNVLLVIDKGEMTIIPPEIAAPALSMGAGGRSPEFEIISVAGAAVFNFDASVGAAEKALVIAMPKVIAKRQKSHTMDMTMRGQRFLDYSLSVMGVVLSEVASVAETFAVEMEKFAGREAGADVFQTFQHAVGSFLEAGQALGLSGPQISAHLRDVILPEAVHEMHNDVRTLPALSSAGPYHAPVTLERRPAH